MRHDDPSTTRPHFGGAGRASRRPELSVVVPVFDEEANIAELVRRLARVLDRLGVDAEVVVVDDGSTDGTYAALARANQADPRFRVVGLSRNFGHQAAISAGLVAARGEAVAVMDGDLQDPPEALGSLWDAYNQGWDVVYAVRASRAEGLLKRLAYSGFYRLMSKAGSIDVPRDAGDFGVMSRRVVDLINAMPEHRRYVRGLRAWVGFRQCGIPVDRAERAGGQPKYTLGKLIGLALDGLIGFSDAPPRLASVSGAALAFCAFLAAIMAGALVLTGHAEVPGWAWVALLIAFLGGSQLVCLGVLGEYLCRMLDQVRGRPLYVVRRRVGIDAPTEPLAVALQDPDLATATYFHR
jgi:glycosyltransferase involved in cell wall biosynthesis